MVQQNFETKFKSICRGILDESDEIQTIQIFNRAGKERGMYHNWYNVRDLNTNELSSINWDAVRKWRPIVTARTNQENLIITTDLFFSELIYNIAKVKYANSI